MNIRFARWTEGLSLVVFALALTGCPPKQKKLPPAETTEAVPETETPETGAEGVLEIGSEWVTVPSLAPVYFDSNRAELNAEARAALKSNAAVLKTVREQAPGVQIRLEGHCDQRGTLEYNLALGQRRANAVRDYYASLGLPKAGLSTISYGEERPGCTDNNEGCWWRNRRGETALKSPRGAIRIPMDSLPAEQRP
jgi:peptidoglycan-associated lipoprotein